MDFENIQKKTDGKNKVLKIIAYVFLSREAATREAVRTETRGKIR